MFIKIARNVRVYVQQEYLDFLQRMSGKSYFLNSQLDPNDIHKAKHLADKCILVRKKLDNDVQYALNKSVVGLNYELKKSSRTGKTDRGVRPKV
jgi:hypothetical protein